MSAPHHSTLMKRDSLGKLLPGETQPVADRFWAKVHKTDTCWLWTAAVASGYGRFWLDGKQVQAHRWAYEQVYGPIPSGMDIDHLCRVRHCVNPAHMEPVTRRTNVLRGNAPLVRLHRAGFCKRGHVVSASNTYFKKNGTVRDCKLCRRKRMAKLKVSS